MSDLEKYLIENRQHFDLDEPEAGHFKRFDARLGHKAGRRNPFIMTLQIAASLAVILTSGILIIKTTKSGDKMAVHGLSPEVQEANEYYVRQVDYKYEQISELSFDSKEEKEVLLKELSEMDSYYKQLLKDLDANPGDERAVNALISHYQVKLEVMDHIIDQLEKFKSQNNQNSQSHEERL